MVWKVNKCSQKLGKAASSQLLPEVFPSMALGAGA